MIALVPVSPHLLATVGIAGLIGWRVYRRVRRTIGRQRVRPWALGATTLIFSVAFATLAFLDASRPPMIEALAAGLVAGVVLGAVGLRLTRFETAGSDRAYVPNTLLGIGVSLLFIGRLAYRLLAIYGASGKLDPTAMPRFGSSPLTLGCFALVAGYYVTFSAGILWRDRRSLAVPAASGEARTPAA